MTDAEKLQLARACFLELIGSALDYSVDTDLNKHDQPETTYSIVCRDFELRQLVEALGIRIRDDELADDAIDRALKDD